MDIVRKALIVPWLDLREKYIVGRVNLLPRSVAIEQAGNLRIYVEARTKMFVGSDSIGRHLLHGHPIHPQNVTVIFLDDIVDEDEARRAVNALCFATIAANDPPVSYANGTTFFHFVQSLGGEPSFVGDRRPRLHGSVLDGYHVDYIYESRPRNAEHFHYRADDDFLAALVAASEQEPDIADALSVIRMAASDSPDVDLTLALTLYATATVRILAQPGIDDKLSLSLTREKSLLQPLLGIGVTGDEFEYHIARVWKSIRDIRNNWWHPTKMKMAAFPFERQTVVRPHLIAFRMVQALLAARLVEMGLLELPKATAIVRPIEDWIASIAENDPRDSSEAHSLSPYKRRTFRSSTDT